MIKPLLIILSIITTLFIIAFMIKLVRTDHFKMKENLKVSCDAFANGGLMPIKYTGLGEDVSPSIKLEDLSAGAVSIAIVMDDLDFPFGTYNHWVIWNIPADMSIIPEAVSKGPVLPLLGNAIQGKSQYGGKHYYRGPLPPFGSHTYVFKVFVLDRMLDLDSNAGKIELMRAMEGHILQYGTLKGEFGK